MKIENGIMPNIDTTEYPEGKLNPRDIDNSEDINAETKNAIAEIPIETGESKKYLNKTTLVEETVKKIAPDCLKYDGGGRPLYIDQYGNLAEIEKKHNASDRRDLTAGIVNFHKPDCLEEDGGH